MLLHLPVLGVALAVASGPAGPPVEQRAEIHPPQYQVDGWTTSCWRGDDGFAVNCQAHKHTHHFGFRLAVADSQFVQSVEHDGCASSVTSWVFREDLLGLSASRRRKMTADEFMKLGHELAAHCPGIPKVNRRDFELTPDIAVAGQTLFR